MLSYCSKSDFSAGFTGDFFVEVCVFTFFFAFPFQIGCSSMAFFSDVTKNDVTCSHASVPIIGLTACLHCPSDKTVHFVAPFPSFSSLSPFSSLAHLSKTFSLKFFQLATSRLFSNFISYRLVWQSEKPLRSLHNLCLALETMPFQFNLGIH